MKGAALASVFLAGCTTGASPAARSSSPEASPELLTIAVLPFQNGTADVPFDGEEFGRILATELVKRTGHRAIRPHDLKAILEPGEDLSRFDTALRAAVRSKAHAILALKVTDFDPYDPPRLAVNVQFFRTEARTLSDAQVDAIAGSASWRRGAFALTRDRAGHGETAFEAVYDARDEGTRWKIEAYARAHHREDILLPPGREIFASPSHYVQFVSSDIVRRLLDRPAAE